MRLPRRVPWASLDDLNQVCIWIYYDDSEESKILAIQTVRIGIFSHLRC